MLNRIVLPGTVLLIIFVVGALPVLRMKARHGITGVVVHHATTPFQRVLGTVLGGTVAAVLAFTVAYSSLGAQRLGIWELPAAIGVAGWTLIGAGVAIIALAQLQMGSSWRMGIDRAPTALTTSGLFRLVRNPIYTGIGLSLLGMVLVTPCAWTVMGFLQSAALLAIQARLEEQHLGALHGEVYVHYAGRVGRFLPGVGRGL